MKIFKLFEEDNHMDIQYTNSPWSMMEPLAELNDFEPQTRQRSNTWPLPRPENYVDPPDMVDDGSGVLGYSNKCLPPLTTGTNTAGAVANGSGIIGSIQTPHSNNMPPTTIAGGGSVAGGCLPAGLAATKKNSSRRNAWGNLSYADLITQAITSAPDNRLTLSQIYEWMVSNVPYFKDKGDSNSSAGWKNSIRHNLSLHNRFMRVQNEGTGKSSWWMINPDAKPGKSVRRRAASMETSKFEKRRGRVKKKVEALRNGLTADATPSPSSSVSEGLDMFPDSPLHSASGFQLSPDFRPRASSAASSCGRLSPIPAVVGVEPDWSSPPQYTGRYGNDTLSGNTHGSYSPDQLAGNLEHGMKIEADAYLQGYVNGQTNPPPPYSTAPNFEPTFPTSAQTHRDLASLSNNSQHYHGVLPSQCPIHRLQPCNCINPVLCKIENLSPTAGMSPDYPQSEPSPEPLANHPFIMGNAVTPSSTTMDPLTPATPGKRPPSNSPPLTPQPATLAQQIQASTTMMGQLMGALNNSTLLDDLNLNIETLHGGFDCNVDEVIKHELSMEGSLDFNFVTSQHQSNQLLPGHLIGGHHEFQQGVTQQPSQSAQSIGQSGQGPSVVTYSTASSVVTSPSWVH